MYHEYVGDAGETFDKPDLAIAFNSGCGTDHEQTSTWPPTLSILIDKNIPTVFTVCAIYCTGCESI